MLLEQDLAGFLDVRVIPQFIIADFNDELRNLFEKKAKLLLNLTLFKNLSLKC